MSVGRSRGVRRVGRSRIRKKVNVATQDGAKVDDAMMRALAKGDKELVMTVREKPDDGMEMRMYMQKRRTNK